MGRVPSGSSSASKIKVKKTRLDPINASGKSSFVATYYTDKISIVRRADLGKYGLDD